MKNLTQPVSTALLIAAGASLGWGLLGRTPVYAQSKQPVPEVYSKTPAIEPGHAPKLRFEELKATGRVFKVGNSTGDEVMSGLMEFAEKNHIGTAEISGLGGFSSAVLSAYDPEKRGFKTFVIDQKCEVVSFTGTISTQNGKPNVHAHVMLGCVDGSTHGGHLIEGQVNPVMDLLVTEYQPVNGSAKSSQ